MKRKHNLRYLRPSLLLEKKKQKEKKGGSRQARESSRKRVAFISRAGHTVHIARRGRAFAGKIAFGTKSASSTKVFLLWRE
jgi:hypothetical protein